MTAAPHGTSTTGAYTIAAVVAEVQADEGRYGPRFTWWFVAEGPTGQMKLRTWTSRHLNPMSRASAYIKAVVGRPLKHGEVLDVGALAGRPCTLLVAPNDEGYLVIKDVLPAADEIPF